MDDQNATTAKPEKKDDQSIWEEIEVAGGQLIDKVKSIIQEGNVRQVRLSDQDGDFALAMPMTVGVIAGGAIALTAPWLAILGVVAALVTKVKLEVERTAPAPTPESPATPQETPPTT